jgi:hypothetical protein
MKTSYLGPDEGYAIKTAPCIITFLCTATISCARTSPEAFLSQIPAAPGNCCGITEAAKDSFNKTISDLDRRMEKEMRERNRECESYLEKNREAIA